MIKEMRTKKKRAFTLVELVIVIAVIGILAAILIPTFSSVVDNAKFASDVTDARNMSIKTKEAVILGAKDSAGNPMNVNMNETAGVIAFLKANNFSLIPESKDSAFYYDRATGEIKILRDEDAFGEGALADDEEKFEQDCVEAILSNRKSFVIIDQNPSHPVVNFISTIKTLASTAEDSASEVGEVVSKMSELFTYAIENTKLNSTIKQPSVKAYLESFSPLTTYYVGVNASYTASTSGKMKNIIFDNNTEEFTPYNGSNIEFTFEKNIIVPSTINTFKDDCVKFIDTKTTIELNKSYDDVELANVGSLNAIDNTGEIRISYVNLSYDNFIYNQYGYRYHDYTKEGETGLTTYYKDLYSGLTEGTEGTLAGENLLTVTTDGYKTELEGTEATKLLKSVYAVPKVKLLSELGENSFTISDVFGNKIDGGSSDAFDDTGSYSMSVYTKDINSLTVIYGVIVTPSTTYRIQDIAYIRSLSATSLTLADGTYLCVADPLQGMPYYNLKDIKIYAGKTGNEPKELVKQNSGVLAGDYTINKAEIEDYEYVYVNDSNGNTIIKQYI